MVLELDLRELKRVVDRLFDHILNDLHVEQVVVDEDYYWDVDPPDLYHMSKTPTEEDGGLSIGSLVDDWDLSKHLLSEESEPVPLTLDHHVAPLLRYVGSRVRGF